MYIFVTHHQDPMQMPRSDHLRAAISSAAMYNITKVATQTLGNSGEAHSTSYRPETRWNARGHDILRHVGQYSFRDEANASSGEAIRRFLNPGPTLPKASRPRRLWVYDYGVPGEAS